MIASLPMYDRPKTAPANDRLWTGIRSALGYGPVQLTREGSPWDHWRDPNLLFSQTCGLPYRAELHTRLALVASPVHDLPDCPPGHYYSVIVAHADDPRDRFNDFADACLAYSSGDSQSGWAAPVAHARELGVRLTPGPATGSHRASARAVASGDADLAAIDAVSWAMMSRWDSFAARLKVVGRTAPSPALPFVTARTDGARALAEALAHAIAGLSAADRDALCLHGTVSISRQDYLKVPLPPAAPVP